YQRDPERPQNDDKKDVMGYGSVEIYHRTFELGWGESLTNANQEDKNGAKNICIWEQTSREQGNPSIFLLRGDIRG
ncbi:MAG TPA: hypothetical protein VJ044_14165, partial [Candidatus Hodarchaeales archaeon]|nr:hypothetical protein [Candidatus Hodarchaeales archaeon]